MATEKTTFFSLLKNLFFIMIFLQYAPSFFSDIKKKFDDTMSKKTNIGCIPLQGEIRNAAWFLRHVKKFSDDKKIEALWIKINSPGGFPAASQAMFLGLLEARKKKPVFVEIQDWACSGGYYVAAAADKIIALPSSLVGNIGVLMQLVHLKKSMEYLNMNVEYIKSGKYKATGNKFTDLTPEQRLYLQGTSDDMYKQFTEDVARQRNLSLNDLTSWADGKALTGNQALKQGLIDRIGSTEEVDQEIKKALNSDFEIKMIYPEPPSFLSRMMGEDDRESQETSMKCTITEILSLFASSLNKKQMHSENILMPS